MNKIFIALAITFTSFSAFAATGLTCWNMFSKKGSKPILTAKIGAKNKLKLTFNVEDAYWESYIIDKKEDAGEQWGHKPAYTKSSIESPAGAIAPVEITKSTYKGMNGYSFAIGKYSFRSPYYNTQGTYAARLTLPPDLSPKALEEFRIRDSNERSNAVVVLPPAYDSHQGGNNYLRMFCKSE